MLGSANLDGSPLMHIMTGNLSHQIEHHLFPDMPSPRYAQVAPLIRDICRRYGLPYTSGPLYKQYAGVLGTIARLALPGGSPAQDGVGEGGGAALRAGADGQVVDAPQAVDQGQRRVDEHAGLRAG